MIVVSRPSARQAISSSRSASQARPERQPAQPVRHPVGEEGERQDDVVEEHDAVQRGVLDAERAAEAAGRAVGVERQPEEARARDAGDAVRAAGQALPVEQHDADHLAERQRHDGEIVAAQAQDREAQQDAPERGEDAGERQAQPERQAEMLGEQRIGVGADGVERDVAEIEQAGEADHDVEPPAEHDVGDDEDREIHHIAVRDRQPRQREAEADECQRHPGAEHRGGSRQASPACRRAMSTCRPRQRTPQVDREPQRENHADGGGDGGPARDELQRGLRFDGAIRQDRDRQQQRDQGPPGRIEERGGDRRCRFCARRRRWPERPEGGAFAAGHPHTFSISGRPSRPCGMKIRMIARIENAATSL